MINLSVLFMQLMLLFDTVCTYNVPLKVYPSSLHGREQTTHLIAIRLKLMCI